MPASNLKNGARINAINAVITDKEQQKLVIMEYKKSNGDWAVALSDLQSKLTPVTFQKVTFAHSLAEWSDDHLPLVKAITSTPNMANLRDVALNFNTQKLVVYVDPKAVPDTVIGNTDDEKKKNFAITLRRKLFALEPTAVLHRMVNDAEIPIADASVRAGVATFLNNQPDFNIRTTSIYTVLQKPEAFKDIADEHRASVIGQLKTLQRVQALSPVPEAVPVLMNANLTSAFHVGELPESTFLNMYGETLGEETARQVYTNAINTRIRNEHALMTMREAVRGTGLAIIDGPQKMETRIAKMQAVADKQPVRLNLEELFGSIDFCECGECNSVYSPAAYFVELLQYLRNNNLDPANLNTGQSGYAGTPLEKLFRRRPDLACLELTCENTNTILPYIDLVNEVMESFVVHLGDYHASATDPRQAKLDVFNVEDETSGELLAQPQHTNYEAYCILKNAVYPFTLPYHQPIDAIRIFLNYLGTSYCELLDKYRAACEICADPPLSPEEQKEMEDLHKTTLDRAVDAEFLGLTQEEYIILTKEAFWPKRYFDITLKKNHTDKEYSQKIGVRPVHEYYGYETELDMLSADEKEKKGLTFVKKHFLPRTGIQYVDLVELLKTQFINPNFPQGKALTLTESIRFSYRFLQTLVDKSSNDPKLRFVKLIDFLEKAQPFVPMIDAMLHPDPCKEQTADWRLETKDLRNWVYCYFERVGKLIVLESGEGPRLPFAGKLKNGNGDFKGTLHLDGTITDQNGAFVGNVTVVFDDSAKNVPFVGPVILKDRKSFTDIFGKEQLSVIDGDNKPLAILRSDGLSRPEVPAVALPGFQWSKTQDTCDLGKVRLVHLDGSSVTPEEYDRMQRFIRLWRKMGWTIDEMDKALIGLTANALGTDSGETSKDCHYIGFETFKNDCQTGMEGRDGKNGDEEDLACPDFPEISAEITPQFLRQLVAVRKLLDLTGLPLPKLLTFWANISTVGEKSLYSRLFLTHNLVGIDKVFLPDKNGNYLTQSTKLADHIPVLMAALKLKADDITAIIKFRGLNGALTQSNVSTLYRHSLLAKTLHVKVPELEQVIALFGDPFKDAHKTLELIETWGRMEDAGFAFRQLNYVIRDHDDALRPLAPAKRTVLQLTKTLYDGLNAIDRDHPDVEEDEKEKATPDLVRAKAGLLFEQSVVERIIGLLEGTTVYTTNAPANLTNDPANSTFVIPETLQKKLKHNNQKTAVPPRANIQVTGILTDAEIIQAKGLSTQPGWAEAIDRAGKQAFKYFIGEQAFNFYDDILFGIFPDETEAKKVLFAGDVNIPADKLDPTQPDPNTVPMKQFYFLKHFLPFLRRRLSQRLISDGLSNFVGLTSAIAQTLLTDILVVGTSGQPAMSALEKIKVAPASSGTGWKGYLIPSAEAEYSFVAVGDTQPASLLIDGQTISFSHQQEDPSNVWFTDPVKLKTGRLYWIEVADRPANQLRWKTAAAPTSDIPASALLPDYSTSGAEEIIIKLHKAAILINGFGMNVDEVIYWQTHATDFGAFDFNVVTLQHWKRMQAYTAIRDSLPKVETTLLDLFGWASKLGLKPEDAAKLSEKIAAVTGWKKENIEKMVAPEHFDLNRPEAFRNEINLVKLQKALQVADKIGIEIDSLFEWAKPGSKFWAYHKIAEDIGLAVRARFDQEDWEKVVRPLNNQLRENQKQALISYLLVQQDLINWGVMDADSLFEFFLIDVQMSDCMETSRIKQAISTVQVFVQRCFLGLEEKYGVLNTALDRERWEWMSRYRIWEANRKVFLYPENWIVSGLRDDKSQFYKELESELLQKDINTQTVQDALKSYLFKVDEVANLKVVGLFVEQEIDESGKVALSQDGKPVDLKLHVFSRTRNAPYFFYYRYLDIKESNWYPWEKVQVDIPVYDTEIDGKIDENGTYLIPVVWNKRLLIFFPQFVKKTNPNSPHSNKTFQDIGKEQTGNAKPDEFWEIKMGWSERRNGKWTQKQISSNAIYHSDGATYPTPTSPLDISRYEFVPRLVTTRDPKVVIDVYYPTASSTVVPSVNEAFHFAGSQILNGPRLTNPPEVFFPDFHYTRPINISELSQPRIHSLQATNNDLPFLIKTPPHFSDGTTSVVLNYGNSQLNFYHPFIHELLGKLITGSLDALFAYYLNFNDPTEKDDAYGGNGTAQYHELKRAYSLYNWEASFHAPMQLADRLLKSQQFDRALKMCHYVFNPLAKGGDDKRFWQFPPFKEIDAENVLEKLFMGLQPNVPDNTPNQQINEWRDKPFQPHVIARSRPSAYMKWTVMKYIEIMIAYGDYYFRQFTLETLPLAIQCYVIASHLFGPRGQKIPKRGKIQPQTYNSLLDKWDAFSNAMVELELAFPFSNQTPLPIGVSNGVVGLANVFGFATSLYFCIPDNPKLRSLRDTIDDRLFKIRHCQDIDGVFRKLPLFEPPIDPGLLVQAAAQGLSLSSVLNDLNSPMPNYRFYYLLQKALELCSELKVLGNAFLLAKEKGDAEALSKLRAKHESSFHNLVMEVKKQQLDESQKSLEALQQSRKGPVYRLQHFLKLIGEDLGKVPNDTTDFSELPNQIEQPVDESGLKLIQFEKEEMDKASSARDLQIGIGALETLASIFHVIPSVKADGKPFGIGVTTTVFAGTNIANAAQAVARGLQIGANDLSYQSTNAGRKGGFLRQLQDRIQQANISGYEIKSIDKQILTQQIRINIANQEITNQQKQIDNAQEVEEFLRNKYTNEELYSWMEGEVRTLYYQAYTLAYELAKKAEKVFRFERGLSSSNFIQFGYWDAAHDGLLAGERLYLGLKQLESAYQEKRGYDFEVSKPISLRQVNPLALLQLKETGTCEFVLPEVLFDMDYPGHYMRRIKSVALTIPCIVGPYTSLNCTLRLLEHKFRINAIAKDKNDYLEKADETDERFSTVNVPITSIATSTGQNDSGVSELNFRDERYIPFEGAGVISKWRLELPVQFRQFDYDTISDVILNVRYTSIDGGDKLKKAAADLVQKYIKSVEDLSQQEGLFAAFDLIHDFPSEWYKAMQPPAGATERILTLNNVYQRLPTFTKGRSPDKIPATDIYLFTTASIPVAAFTLKQNGDDFTFTAGPQMGTIKSFAAKDIRCQMGSWQLKIQDVNTEIEKLWLIVRYVLKSGETSSGGSPIQ